MEIKEEWDHVLLTLQLAYAEHKTQTAIKTAARIIRQKVKNTSCYEWLGKVCVSPAPMRVMLNEIKERRPDDLKYYGKPA